jgi:P4 family phage/plasmid primase-like protien
MAQQNDNLARFLKEHLNKNKKDAHRVTHTRIGDVPNNIYPGSYIIEGEDEVTLHDLIYEQCVRGNRMEYLTEVQRKGEPATWIVDLDFRYAHDVGVRQHDNQWINEIIWEYLEVMKDYYNIDETPINIYICEKPHVNQLADGTLTKDGVHLVFCADIPHKIQLEIRRRMIESETVRELLERLPLTNTADGVFDKGLSQGGTNWQLLGCRKPTYEKYRVVGTIKAQLDPADGAWMINDVPPDANGLTREQYAECSVRTKHHRWQPNERGQAVLNPPSATNKPRAVMVGGDGFEDVLALTRMLKPDRAESGNFEQWRKVGMTIKSILGEEGKQLFQSWTDTYSSAQRYSELDYQWDKWQGKGEGALTIGSLHYWAKEDSPAEYKARYAEQHKVLTENSIADAFEYAMANQTDNAHAKLFVEMYKGKYMCTDYTRGIYQEFKANCLWSENIGGSPIKLKLSGEYRDKFIEHMQAMQAEANNEDAVPEDAEVLKKRIKRIEETAIKLEKVNEKNNILSSIKDIIYDVEFLRNMNKEKWVLPMRGQKVINLQTLEVAPRTENHKYNYECDFEYIPELSEEDEQDVRQYWSDLFLGKEDTIQTVLDILKSSLIGEPLRYIYFMTGSGRNGKSTLFKILGKALGKAIDAISKSVIVQAKASSNTTTELEKLDKCRIAYASEFDDQQDTLAMVIIKQITGGDPINCRALYKTDETLTPTANLMVLTNNLPKFKVEQSTLDRIIVIPFGAVFPVDKDYETRMVDKRSQIMSYILRHGRIRDKFELSEDMRVAGEEYKNDQEDSLKDFIAERTVKDANCWIDRDQFRMGYNDWCSIRKLKQDTSSNNSFTRAMAKHGYAVKSAGTKKRYLGIKWDNTPQASAGGGGADAETDIGETDDQWE